MLNNLIPNLPYLWTVYKEKKFLKNHKKFVKFLKPQNL